MPNVISSLIVFVGRGGRLPVAPFSQSSQACAVPVARNSVAMLVRSSRFIAFTRMVGNMQGHKHRQVQSAAPVV